MNLVQKEITVCELHAQNIPDEYLDKVKYGGICSFCSRTSDYRVENPERIPNWKRS
jgi:hypothetical protein